MNEERKTHSEILNWIFGALDNVEDDLVENIEEIARSGDNAEEKPDGGD